MNEDENFLQQLLTAWKYNPVFRDNLTFLTQVHLRSLPSQIILESLNRVEDFFRYDLSNQPPPCPLHILNVEDTLDLLLENPKSFCRFGDGEVRLINGETLEFQDYNEKLASRFCEILQSTDDTCYVGVDHRYFRNTADIIIRESEKTWMRQQGYAIRQTLLKYCNRKKLYISSIFTCFYLDEERTQEKYQMHYDKVKKLFRNRKLAIFSGETVFDKIKYNVFEYATEKIHILTASKNAWNHYEEILDDARKIPKDFTLCFILGPTATVLAYDLAQEGYMAWDIGHIAKDYDLFTRNEGKNSEIAKNFWAPD